MPLAGRKQGRLLAAAIGMLAVALFATTAAESSMAASDARAANQKKLENAVARLDTRIGSTMAKAKKGKKLKSYISSRERETMKLVDTYMTASIDGYKGSSWFRALDCVDLNLTKARLREKKSLKGGSVAKLLGSAKKCEQMLQRGTSGSGNASLASGIAAFDSGLNTAIADAGQGKKVGSSIASLRKQLLEFADAQLTTPVNLVRASQWFRQLSCVSVGLAQAKLRDKGTLKRGKARSMLSSARKCVQTFRTELKKGDQKKGSQQTGAITFGSNNLSTMPASLLGRYNEDIQYWLTALSPQPAAAGYVASTTAPADGMVTDIKIRGYALDGDNGPRAAQPIRFSVARPTSGRQVEVVTTTDPPFTLPATDGVHSYSMSNVRWRCCAVKKGDVISLDARFGEHAVFGRLPGAVTDRFSPTQSGLPTQNPGYKWDGTPGQGVELLMQVTMQPGS